MGDATIAGFIADVMQHEIAPAIPYDIDRDTAREFGVKVLDRFRNPLIQHQWINITVQYSSKMRLRCIRVLLKHYQNKASVPVLFTLGFAAYLFFLKPVKLSNDKYFGEANGKEYPIDDDMAEMFYKRWQTMNANEVVRDVMRDITLWGEDLSLFPGFEETVTRNLD